jgi:hypothetical protein
VNYQSDASVRATIDVCVSTLNNGLVSMIGRLPVAEGVTYLIGHQITEAYSEQDCERKWNDYSEFRPDIRRIKLKHVGLCRNRNALIDDSTADLILFSDDDVDYLPGFETEIRKAYLRYSDAGAITFRSARTQKNKRERADGAPHNTVSAVGVSSIEITVRRQVLMDRGIRFDERFGLGTSNPSGEEFIFVMDLLRAQVRVRSSTSLINSHAELSSGTRYYESESQIQTKGRMFRRGVGGAIAVVLMALFAIKKYSEYRGSWSLPRFFVTMMSGKL